MRSLAVSAGVFLIAVSLAGCGPVTEKAARENAVQAFEKARTKLRYPAAAFAGPFETTIGASGFAYAWRLKDPKGIEVGGSAVYGILIGVTSDGDTNVSYLDRPQSGLAP